MKGKWMAVVGVLAVALAATLVIAAPDDDPAEKGKAKQKLASAREAASAKVFEQLDLTVEQKQQVDEIRNSTREKNAELFESAKATKEQMAAAKKANDTARLEELRETMKGFRTQMAELRKAEREQVLAILTPEQQGRLETLEARRSEVREKRGAGKQRRGKKTEAKPDEAIQ